MVYIVIDMDSKIVCGDALTKLRWVAAESVHCCITSPPYYGLRNYGTVGQLGLERTPEEYVTKLVEVFGEVRRVLRKDGTLWLVIGDSYVGALNTRPSKGGATNKQASNKGSFRCGGVSGLKRKDLIGIPWRVAFALQANGWWLRQDIIWSKPNPMPESVTDRCTKSHEYIFMLAKSQKYYYDAEAVRELAKNDGKFIKCGPNSRANVDRDIRATKKQDLIGKGTYTGFNARWKNKPVCGRNRRSVWTIATKPFKEAHFATFPPDLVEPMILSGCPKGGMILDPFFGAGTTGMVAKRFGRDFIGIDLNPKYCEMAKRRIFGILGI